MRRNRLIQLAVLAASLLLAACAQRDASRQIDPAEAAVAAGPATPGATPAGQDAAAGPAGKPPENLGEAVDDAVHMVQDNLDAPLPDEGPVQDSLAAEAEEPCKSDDKSPSLLDKTQRGVYWTVCGATRWFDGFFGDRSRYDATVRESNGRIGLGAFWDQRDGLDMDYRFRAQLALPAAEKRLKDFQGRFRIGRGTDQELIEDRGVNDGDPLPGRFDEVNDPNWLLGVGFRRGQTLNRGFDFDVGVRFRLPPDPFVKGRWFRNWTVSDDALLRLRQTVFWTDRRGLGETTQVDLDKLLQDNLLFRWSNSGTLSQDRDGLDWTSAFAFFQGLSNRRAFTYRGFIRGETGREVSLQNFGVELGFRRRILRRWLFAELRASATFPRFERIEERELNLGLGLFFDMYFGPVPDEQLL